MSKRFHLYAFIVLALPLLWLLFNLSTPAWVNGWFYRIEDPVQVVQVGDDKVTLRFDRFSLRSMRGTFTNELQCENQLYEFGETTGPLERGHNTFDFALPLPDDAEGKCCYRGDVEYMPFGFFGPTLIHPWESEGFIVPE